MDNITDKIRRLLALADNVAATPNEAGVALERARRLASRHAIDLERVRAAGQPEEPIIHIAVDLPMRVSLNRKMSISTACQFFRVNAVIADTCLVLIGTEADVQIAAYAIDFMAGSASRALAKFVGRRRLAHSTRMSFLAGFYHAVRANLRKGEIEERAEAGTMALATIVDRGAARRQAIQDQLFPSGTTKVQASHRSRFNGRAGALGAIAGADTHVRPAVRDGGSREVSQLLIASVHEQVEDS